MMAEEQQDDLSMEDILSSIKDILDKDSQSASPEAEAPAVASQAASEPAVEPEDDVYDLSKSMIIDEPLLPETEGDIDLNLDDVSADIDISDITVPEVEAEKAPAVAAEPEPVVEAVAETVVEAEPVEEPVIEEADPIDNLSVDVETEVEAEPIFSPEDDASGGANELQLPDDSVDVEDLLAAPVAETKSEIPAEEPADVEEVAENIDDILTSASKVIYADNKADNKAKEATAPVAAEKPAEPEAKTAEPEADAVDVSANIISNFAKMFAEKAPAEEAVGPETVKAPEVKAEIKNLGDGSKTIAEVVEEVIKDIISASVSAEINSNVDITAYAKEEIKAQTKAWLDAKLPAIVEAAVQKEIERVMAKVGK